MLIFLDFDGVLHPTTARSTASLFSQTAVLELFFRQPEYLDCEFVISSTWRVNYNLCELVTHFSFDFQQRMIGTTPILPTLGTLKGSREREILAWLHDFGRMNESWIALDDLHGYFEKYSEHVFFCDGTTGLTLADLPALARHIMQFKTV